MGQGFWFDPESNLAHQVDTHDAWIRRPENQQRVGLSSSMARLISQLDPIRDIDELRFIALLHGLVRLREYATRNRQELSIQLYRGEADIRTVLDQMIDAIPNMYGPDDRNLRIQNMYGPWRSKTTTICSLKKNTEGIASELAIASDGEPSALEKNVRMRLACAEPD